MFAIWLLFVFLFIGIGVYRIWCNSPKQKGKRGEQMVHDILLGLGSGYTILDDVMLRTSRGTTQIDHIAISRCGIFTIETKNYRGEIYGYDEDLEWTQIIRTNVTYRRNQFKTYRYVTKNKLYNPVRQSRGHALAIKELLPKYGHIDVIPIVVFVGDATIEHIHTNSLVVYPNRLLSVIGLYNVPRLTEEEVQDVVNSILSHNVEDEYERKIHEQSVRLKQHLAKSTNNNLCPRCGGLLVHRTGKYGSFYGCSNFPRCKYTK